MKKIFTLLAALFAGASATTFAQETHILMATLQHGDETQVFYGQDAFSNAYYAAADSGDVITLSGGTFNQPSSINKSLTIIGNGTITNEGKGIFPTIIDRLFFQPADAVNDDGETVKEAIHNNGSRVEGIRCGDMRFQGNRSLEKVSLEKCLITKLYFYTPTENCIIRQCVIPEDISGNLNSRQSMKNLFITNSYIRNFNSRNSFSDGSTIAIDHSILQSPSLHIPLNISNSILKTGDGYMRSSHINNCIFIDVTPYVFTGSGNWVNKKLAGIFEEEMSDLAWDGVKTYKLKYPDQYRGTDGTEVGLYGGSYPFNLTPTVPQVKAVSIDPQTSADGKLKVSVTVEAQTED